MSPARRSIALRAMLKRGNRLSFASVSMKSVKCLALWMLTSKGNQNRILSEDEGTQQSKERGLEQQKRNRLLVWGAGEHMGTQERRQRMCQGQLPCPGKSQWMKERQMDKWSERHEQYARWSLPLQGLMHWKMRADASDVEVQD